MRERALTSVDDYVRGLGAFEYDDHIADAALIQGTASRLCREDLIWQCCRYFPNWCFDIILKMIVPI